MRLWAGLLLDKAMGIIYNRSIILQFASIVQEGRSCVKYLNKDSVFVCKYGTEYKPVSNQFKVLFSGSSVLTENCVFTTTPGKICPQTQKPCIAAPLKAFGPSRKVTVNGERVLTDKSYLTCPLSGRLDLRGGSNIETEAAKPQIGYHVVAGTEGSAKVQIPEDKSTFTHIDTDIEPKTNNTAQPPEGDGFCNDCKHYEACAYRSSSPESGNDPNALRRNYKQKRPDEYEKIKAVIDNAKTHNAAHHIIPGNDSYKLSAKLLRLGNALDVDGKKLYDINNALNCILLPTNMEDLGKNGTYEKKAVEYEVMSETGMQWHSGGHGYKLPAEYIPKDKRLNAYRDVVRSKLSEIESMIDDSDICPYLDEGLKKAVVNALFDLQDEIRHRLNEFKDDPKHSEPYYVSAVAMRYAYEIPRTVNAVALIRKVEKINAVLFRFNEKKGLTYITETDRATFKAPLAEEKMHFIRFCKNAMYFILPDAETELPFSTGYSRVISLKEPVDPMLNGKLNELEELINNNPVGYSSPVVIMKKRMAE